MAVPLEQRYAALLPSDEFAVLTEIHDPTTRAFVQDLDAILDDEGIPVPARLLATIIHQEFHFGHREPYDIGTQMLHAVRREEALPFTPIIKGKREIDGFDRDTALAFGLLCEARGRFFPATVITDFALIRDKAVKQAGESRLVKVLTGEGISGRNGTGSILKTAFDREEPTDEDLLEAERELVDHEGQVAELAATQIAGSDQGESHKKRERRIHEPSYREMQEELRRWDYRSLLRFNQMLVDYGRMHPVIVDSFNPTDFGVSDYVATRMELIAALIYKGIREKYSAMVVGREYFEEKMKNFAEVFDPELGTDTIEGYRVKVIGLILQFFGRQKADKSLTLADLPIYGERISDVSENIRRRGHPPLKSQGGI
ncbi:MAG: hypothetical protein HYT10_00745 [Candidatus Levybacteria bacterium]|nr:hypothetical protein [Candidatus Levybacteria bacterium]